MRRGRLTFDFRKQPNCKDGIKTLEAAPGEAQVHAQIFAWGRSDGTDRPISTEGIPRGIQTKIPLAGGSQGFGPCQTPPNLHFRGSQKGSAPLGSVACMEEHIEVEGKVVSVLAGTMFRVELDNKHVVLPTISGKMRKRFVRLTPGDRVKMEMSPYDLNKARITWRIG